jgi:hypothetical protein
VVGGVVDSVDTDGVDAQLLELGNITLAAVDIGDGVCELGAATGLVVDATDVETVASLEEGCDGNVSMILLIVMMIIIMILS